MRFNVKKLRNYADLWKIVTPLFPYLIKGNQIDFHSLLHSLLQIFSIFLYKMRIMQFTLNNDNLFNITG